MMKLSAGVMLVWSGAAMEAKTFGQAEIEPYHFLCYALKFAEIDSNAIHQIARDEGEEGQLTSAHDKLLDTLTKEFSIEVPAVSTPLRRALRLKGENAVKDDNAVVHRSAELLQVFEAASKIAGSDQREIIDVCDIIRIILTKPNGRIFKVMKQLDIPLEGTQNKRHSEDAQKYEGLVFHLKDMAYSDQEEKKRIESDPVVKALSAYMAKASLQPNRPCLLIREGVRFAEEILKDTLKFSAAYQSHPISAISVHCNALLMNLSSQNQLNDIRAIEALIDDHNHVDVFLFDSVHRYLSQPIVGDRFADLFTQWVKGLDSSYIFETTVEQYRANFEKQLEWKGVFHIIWLHDLPTDKDYSL